MSAIYETTNNTGPTPAEIEGYRRDAHTHGMAQVRDLLFTRRSPSQAYSVLAQTVEHELACVGLAGVRIPQDPAFKGLIAHTRVSRARSRALPHYGEADR